MSEGLILAFSMVENADDAKDAVHQVFVQIWKRKPQVADDSIRGYLLADTTLTIRMKPNTTIKDVEVKPKASVRIRGTKP